MPSMIEVRCSHSLVCFKSKLFAIGGSFLNTNCEVYDKTSNMFVALETPSFLSFYVKSFLVGNKILVIQYDTKVVYCYDADKDQWSEDVCEAIENICFYSTVRVPLF